MRGRPETGAELGIVLPLSAQGAAVTDVDRKAAALPEAVPRSQQVRLGDIGALFLAALGFGGVSVLTKLAYQAGSTPSSLSATRWILAGALLAPAALSILPVARAREGVGLLIIAFAAGAGLVIGGLLEFEGLSRLPVAALVLLLFLSPVWVALGGWLLWRRRLGWARAGLIALILAGLALLVGSPGSGLDGMGVAFALLASLVYAAMFLGLEQANAGGRTAILIGVAGISAATTALILDPTAVARELGNRESAVYATAIGVTTAGSFALLVAAISRTQALTASVVVAAEPIFASILAWVVLGELLTGNQMIGALAVLIGVLGMSFLATSPTPYRAP